MKNQYNKLGNVVTRPVSSSQPKMEPTSPSTAKPKSSPKPDQDTSEQDENDQNGPNSNQNKPVTKNVKARKESNATDVKLKGIKECSVSLEKLDMQKEAGNLNSRGFCLNLEFFILDSSKVGQLFAISLKKPQYLHFPKLT